LKKNIKIVKIVPFSQKLMKKITPAQAKNACLFQGKRLCTKRRVLSLFVTVTTSTAIRTTAGIAHVNFAERAIITRTVIFTFGNTAADTRVYFLIFFIHHKKIPPCS
jgi:hypothetical protein